VKEETLAALGRGREREKGRGRGDYLERSGEEWTF